MKVGWRKRSQRELQHIGTKSGPGPDQVGTKSALSQHQVGVLRKCLADAEIADLMAIAERANRTKFRDQVLNPLFATNRLAVSIPDKLTNRNAWRAAIAVQTETEFHQVAGWRRARNDNCKMTLVKPVRKRLILMVRAMLNWCVLQGCRQQVIAMNIKQFIASKPAHMVCTVH